jgi:glycosyltransferase involved in cell wall biosynthesis
MKICLVSQGYPPETARGGVGTQTWNKAHALAALGHSVHVVSCSAGAGPDTRTETEGGVTVHRMRPPGVDFPVYETPTYWLGYSWAVLGQLHRLMEAVAFDLIDFPEYGGEGFAYQLDRTPWNWAPVVVQLHAPLAMFVDHIGWPERGSEFHRVGTMMEEISIKRADALMACSANIADLTAGYYGVPRKSIAVVHCGVDGRAFRPRAEAERGSDRPTVLFVGNVVGNKGVGAAFGVTATVKVPRHPAADSGQPERPDGRVPGANPRGRDRGQLRVSRVHRPGRVAAVLS